MSIVVYAGAMQYAAVDILAGGASLISAAVMTVMINIRHLFYGIAMLPEYSKAGKEKPYLIFSLTDETFSLVSAPKLPENVDRRYYNIYVSLLNQIYWVAGSTAGGLLGAFLTIDAVGLDFSMTALFVVSFVEQWSSGKKHLPASAGIVISVICLLIFGPDNFIIPSMMGIAAVLFAARRSLEESDD